MKMSNFKLTKVIGNSPLNWKFIATIDITTGIFKKKVETVEITKEYVGGWYYSKTGELVIPQGILDNTLDNLVRVFEAKHECKLQDMKL